MKMNISISHWLVLVFLMINSGLFAQQITPLDVAKKYLIDNLEEWKLTPEDVSDIRVSDHYTNRKTDISYTYLVQQYQGLEVRSAMFNVTSKHGKIYHEGNSFISNLAEWQQSFPYVT